MKRRPVLIDTDTGVDDALALGLAFRSPEIELVGITTVAGNVEVHRCTRNVHALMDRLCVDPRPRVVAGAARPSRLPLVTAPEVHGRGGMGALTPPSAPPVKGGAAKAAHVIAGLSAKYGAELTIVAIGPLTNVAAAYRLAPGSMRSVGRVISMGGAFHVPGNTGPVAEFNYYVDPHAVETVLRHATDLVIVPLDVTEQLVVTWKDVVRHTHRPSARWKQRLLRGYMQYHEWTEGFLGAYLHDPIAVAEALRPGLLRAEPANVSIVTRNGPARGMTSEQTPASGLHRRVKIARSLDTSAFRDLFERFWTAA